MTPSTSLPYSSTEEVRSRQRKHFLEDQEQPPLKATEAATECWLKHLSRSAPLRTPPTPMRRRRVEQPMPFIESAIRIEAQANQNNLTISIEGARVRLNILEWLGTGDYGTAYRVSGSNGHTYVLKLFGERVLASNSATTRMLKNDLLVYRKFKAILEGLQGSGEKCGRIAQFYHFDAFDDVPDREITEDWVKRNIICGYYLVEYVPHSYEEKADSQLIEMFKGAMSAHLMDGEGELAVDLRKSNVGLDASGELVLFDLAMPGDDEPFNTETNLKSFAEGDENRYAFLSSQICPDFKTGSSMQSRPFETT